jgi:hypothetical protein
MQRPFSIPGKFMQDARPVLFITVEAIAAAESFQMALFAGGL